MPQVMRRFEPMKAYTESPSEDLLKMWFDTDIELWVTDKFDGIRAVMRDDGLKSRSLKPIPNEYITAYLEEYCPTGFDGEIMINGDFSDVQSAVMSREGRPDFTFYVFDDCTEAHAPYSNRIERIRKFYGKYNRIKFEEPRIVRDFATLQKEEEAALDRGNEGLILRVPWGPYKHGRSTLSEAYMLKLKRWEDAEATILNCEPLYKNENEPELDNFGRQKRGSGINNLVQQEKLGAFRCFSNEFQVSFNVGGPFTDLQRCKFWSERTDLIGKTITFKYQKHGTKDAPRSPKFKCFRLD